jgi:hypothetical protein
MPEMEVDYNSKSEQWLQGMQNLPIFSQIEKLKVDQSSFCIEYIIIVSLYSGTFIYLVLQARIDMTAAACESAEKVLEDTRNSLAPVKGQRLFRLWTRLRLLRFKSK